MLPFVFIALTALMSDQQTLTRDLWPQTWEWHNLVQVWQTPGFVHLVAQHDRLRRGSAPC